MDDAWSSWIAHDPDPSAAAELATLDDGELARRFAHPLSFGTAGLRGPLRAGPDGMNLAVVVRASWAVAKVLKDRCLGGSAVVVGRDARHGSDMFATATAEVLAAEGFSVTMYAQPVPTPVVAFAVRRLGAAAGIQITASHNPPGDNGYKVYVDGGLQIVSPTDRDIEAAIAAAPPADEIARTPVAPSGEELIELYKERAKGVRRGTGEVRVALTPMHGVGGAVALDVLRRAGITDVHTVATQFDPDPDFPTVAFPNPEEPGATGALLALAAEVSADLAIALDPDADRCAVGIPTPAGWRMLSGDETGWLLGDYLLSGLHDPSSAVVATTVVSSGMLASIADAYGARHVQTLTGFKWLARADAGVPETLAYAYEEAIGHCVDPDAVRDKDGISAAVLACDLVGALGRRGSSVPELLDQLACRHGVHQTSAVSAHVDAAAVMTRLRSSSPTTIAGAQVGVEDLLDRRGTARTDALIFLGDTPDGATVRLAVRPSGTEPKVKCYIEIRVPPGTALVAARARAAELTVLAQTDARGILTEGQN